MADQPLVLLFEPKGGKHQHTELLTRAGFRVASVAAKNVDITSVLEQGPVVVAAELDGVGAATLNMAKRFRQAPQARLIPFVIYGHQLSPRDIEDAAKAGALWLQLEPGDSQRLVAGRPRSDCGVSQRGLTGPSAVSTPPHTQTPDVSVPNRTRYQVRPRHSFVD